MALFGIPAGLWVGLKNVFRKPWTVEYPTKQRPRPERYRASFALLHDEHGEEACVACLLCEKICPSQVIRIKPGPKRESPVTGKKRQYLEDFTLDLSACMHCELCVQVCPTDALVMVSRPEAPTYSREELLLSYQKLYANEHGAPHSWAIASRLLAMQEPPKPVKPAAAAAAAAPGAPKVAPVAAAAAPVTSTATPVTAVATPVTSTATPVTAVAAPSAEAAAPVAKTAAPVAKTAAPNATAAPPNAAAAAPNAAAAAPNAAAAAPVAAAPPLPKGGTS